MENIKVRSEELTRTGMSDAAVCKLALAFCNINSYIRAEFDAEMQSDLVYVADHSLGGREVNSPKPAKHSFYEDCFNGAWNGYECLDGLRIKWTSAINGTQVVAERQDGAWSVTCTPGQSHGWYYYEQVEEM